MLLAMAKMAPLSLADETFCPVAMRVWVVLSSDWVRLRFCIASMDATFVLMEAAINLPFFSGVRSSF